MITEIQVFEILTVVYKRFKFFRNYPIKSETTVPIERNDYENFSCRSDDSVIFCRKNVFFGKIPISQKNSFFSPIVVEKQLMFYPI